MSRYIALSLTNRSLTFVFLSLVILPILFFPCTEGFSQLTIQTRPVDVSREGTFVAADFGSQEIPLCRSACVQESSVTAYNA